MGTVMLISRTVEEYAMGIQVEQQGFQIAQLPGIAFICRAALLSGLQHSTSKAEKQCCKVKPFPPSYGYSYDMLAKRVRYPEESLPDFRMWESCGTMPLVGGFSHRSSFSPTSSFQHCSIPTSYTLIAQRYCKKDRRYLRKFTRSVEQHRNAWTGEMGDPKKSRRPETSSGTIPTCENQGSNSAGNRACGVYPVSSNSMLRVLSYADKATTNNVRTMFSRVTVKARTQKRNNSTDILMKASVYTVSWKGTLVVRDWLAGITWFRRRTREEKAAQVLHGQQSGPAAPILADQQARPADVRRGARQTHLRRSEDRWQVNVARSRIHAHSSTVAAVSGDLFTGTGNQRASTRYGLPEERIQIRKINRTRGGGGRMGRLVNTTEENRFVKFLHSMKLKTSAICKERRKVMWLQHQAKIVKRQEESKTKQRNHLCPCVAQQSQRHKDSKKAPLVLSGHFNTARDHYVRYSDMTDSRTVQFNTARDHYVRYSDMMDSRTGRLQVGQCKSVSRRHQVTSASQLRGYPTTEELRALSRYHSVAGESRFPVQAVS
ncbi:hypothetical protein PR048_007406 [Dryococelus australis]|uniref:Uncharacterized protein n=1 Tax=Dryococelus australis TaxID=614101 RepID=A0ABQ9HU56_9NEOP|nr:hypothetical protein PR048_007406 [Dryococelus australis]